MRSPMVEAMDLPPAEQERYSDLQAMRSGAGWYVGTAYSNPDGYLEPGSRDSPMYFATMEEADRFLKWIEALPGAAQRGILRMEP